MFSLRAKYPPVAIEIGEGYAGAVKVQQKGAKSSLLEYKIVDLPYRRQTEKVLWADFKLDERFQEGIEELSDWIGRTKKLSIVLPDTSVKTFYIDIENDSGSARELRDVILFKIQKFAPVSSEGTTMAFRRLKALPGGGGHYLVLLSGKSLTSSYERFFAQKGTHVGCIESAGMSVLDMLSPYFRSHFDSSGNFAIVRIETDHFTVAVFNDFELLFSRTKLCVDSERMPMQIAQELKVMSLSAEDQLGGSQFDASYLYGPGALVADAEKTLSAAGRQVHTLTLDGLMDVPNELLQSPEDSGKLMGATSVAVRR